MAKILITERQLERLSRRILKEQNDPPTISPGELVQMYMTNDLNKIISSKQDEIAGQYLISIDGKYPTVKLNYNEGSNSANFTMEDFGARGKTWSLPINGWVISVPTDDIDLISELENSEPYGKYYKSFFDVDDEVSRAVKRQINGVKVKFQFFTNPQISSDGFGGFTFTPIGKKKPKDVPVVEWGQSFPITEITPLGSKRGMRSNVIGLKLQKNLYGEVRSGGLQSQLERLQLTIPAELLPEKPGGDPKTPPPPPPPVIAPEPFVINTKQNYEFDKPGLTSAAKQAIDTQIFDELFGEGDARMKDYVDFLKDKTIIVRAYSSRDADPDAIQNGAYGPCQVSGSKRSEYNQCLSEKRAQNVVDYLKSASNGILSDINFRAVGMGENCKSGNCWKPGKKGHNSSETQYDRRFSVNFPKWDGTTN